TCQIPQHQMCRKSHPQLHPPAGDTVCRPEDGRYSFDLPAELRLLKPTRAADALEFRYRSRSRLSAERECGPRLGVVSRYRDTYPALAIPSGGPYGGHSAGGPCRGQHETADHTIAPTG